MAAEASRGAPRDREGLNRIGNQPMEVKFRARDNQGGAAAASVFVTFRASRARPYFPARASRGLRPVQRLNAREKAAGSANPAR